MGAPQCQCRGNPDHDPDAPCTLDDLAQANLYYWYSATSSSDMDVAHVDWDSNRELKWREEGSQGSVISL